MVMSNAAGEIRIFEDTDNGSNYSGFKADANVTSSVAYQLFLLLMVVQAHI